MLVTRRALLAAPLFGPPPPPSRAPAAVATFRPHIASAISFTPLPGERLSFRAAGLDPAISFPAARSRLAVVLPIAGVEVAVLAFAADPPDAAGRLDLAAIVGWDGTRMRALALEVLSWRAPGGGWLATHIAATAERTRLKLTRDAAAPRGGRPWRRESWTDYLAWRDGAALADAPVRAPLPETWQARLAAVRARVAARLAEPCQDVAEDVIGLVTAAALPPA